MAVYLKIDDVKDYFTHNISNFQDKIAKEKDSIAKQKESFWWPIKNWLFDITRFSNYELNWYESCLRNNQKILSALEYQLDVQRYIGSKYPNMIELSELKEMSSIYFDTTDFYKFVTKSKTVLL